MRTIMFDRDSSILNDDLDDFLEKLRVPITFSPPPEFDWLLSPWSQTRWYLISKNGTTRKDKDGKWINAIKINWHQLLPNGKYLTDHEYSHILERTRRLIASMRTGPYASSDRSETQYTTALYLFSLIRWMILQGYHIPPYATLTFSVLTRSDFSTFCEQLECGMPGIESFNMRAGEFLDSLTTKQLKTLRKPCGLINRDLLGNSINIEPIRLHTPATDIFLRTYETCTKYPEFNISKANKHREHIGNRNERILELAKKPASETVVTEYLRVWNLLHRHSQVIDGLLTFDPIENTTFTSVLDDINFTHKGRTPTIPTNIALYYLDAAIKWVVEYGESLINYRDMLNVKLAEIKGDRTARNDYYAPIAFNNTPIPKELAELGIKRFHRNPAGTSNKKIRENLSVCEATECLLAACFIIITTFSARRRSEILDLTTNCIHDDYDGYVLDIGLQKASAHYILDHVQRPIPTLVMITVDLLLKMNKDARENTKDHVLASYLFTQHKTSGISNLKNNDIEKRLDLFADIIEVPTFLINGDGDTKRRWYIRPHECRRFFAITYFWNSDSSNLQSLSWFMGHLTKEETERYIKEECNSNELPTSIVNLTIEALYSNATKGDKIKLKAIAFEHFDVKNLDFIEEKYLTSFIEDLYNNGSLSVEIISAPETKTGTAICIHFSGN